MKDTEQYTHLAKAMEGFFPPFPADVGLDAGCSDHLQKNKDKITVTIWNFHIQFKDWIFQKLVKNQNPVPKPVV